MLFSDKWLRDANTVTVCDINCPHCNYIAKLLDFWMEGIEVTECQVCGYQRQENKETKEVREVIGYGIMHIEYLNRPYVHVVFDKPVSENEKRNLLENFKDFYIIKEKSFFYLFDGKRVEIAFGSNPQTFEDWVNEQIRSLEYQTFLSRGYNPDEMNF